MRERILVSEKGFSLLELMIAMGITLGVMVIASSLIAQSFNLRSRENRRSEALQDAQRALQVMTRDIVNAGMGLSSNGLVTGDSTSSAIRVRTNLNASTETTGDTADDGEDVKYRLISDANGSFIVRQNFQPASSTAILANRIDSLTIHYYRQRVSYTADPTTCDITSVTPANVTVGTTTVTNEVAANPDLATYVVVSVCVQLPAVGTQNTAGYQPASRVQLVSDAALRNTNILYY